MEDEHRMEYGNNAKFNRILNSCSNPIRMYDALMALAKPSLQQSHDMLEKHQIIIGELTPLLDETKRNQKLI